MMEKFLAWMIGTLLYAVALFPLSVLYGFSDMAYFMVRYVFGYRKTIVRNNILHAFPEKSFGERRCIEKRFYHHLCDCFVETVKLLHISDKELKRRIEVRGTECVKRYAAEKRPIILFIGHYGNWEWVQEMPSRYDAPAVNGEIYKPMRQPVFDRVVHRIRSRFSRNIAIPQSQAMRTIIRLKQSGEPFLIGFIADQRPAQRTHWTTFLHQDTPYVVGGEEIGRYIGAAFLYLDMEKPQRGHYVMTVKELKPIEEEYPYTLAYLRGLEETIRRAPEYWLWSHNRWKYTRDNHL